MVRKKGPTAGTGGHGKHKLGGRGPTPKARERTGHPASRRGATAARGGAQAGDRSERGRPGTAATSAGGRPNAASRGDRPAGGSGGAPGRGRRRGSAHPGTELLVGRNPVVEALRARIPATALYVALGVDLDERIREAVSTAGERSLSILEVSRTELDRLTDGAVHQGIGLQVPPYSYADAGEILATAQASDHAPLLLALDGVTDPRNLGAAVRSAAAFGADGVIVPERRSATMTASAWRASAGAAAHLPVARVGNLVRALRDAQQAGLFVVGLDADGEVGLDDLELAGDPLVVVVGSEGRGLSRLVGETCDLLVSIPMSRGSESLNASVAAAVALGEVARRRRVDRG